MDSGPIVPLLNVSAGASGLAMVGAAAFDDRRFLAALAATLDFAGFPCREGLGLRYCAGNMLGDAVVLYSAVEGPVWKAVMERQ